MRDIASLKLNMKVCDAIPGTLYVVSEENAAINENNMFTEIFNFELAFNLPLRACLHGVGDPGLVGLVSFVFTLWGTQNKRNLPH